MYLSRQSASMYVCGCVCVPPFISIIYHIWVHLFVSSFKQFIHSFSLILYSPFTQEISDSTRQNISNECNFIIRLIGTENPGVLSFEFRKYLKGARRASENSQKKTPSNRIKVSWITKLYVLFPQTRRHRNPQESFSKSKTRPVLTSEFAGKFFCWTAGFIISLCFGLTK